MKKINKIYLSIGCLTAMCLTGCQDDESDYSYVKEYEVQLLAGMKDSEEVNLSTRALPTGYSASDFATDPGKIGVFMTQTTDTVYNAISGYYTWKTADTWKSNVSIMYDEKDPTATINDYYVYGFMPVMDGVGASITSSNFSNGAVMTLTNVPPTSADDVCIISGVLNGVKNTEGTDYKPITDVDIKVAAYNYTASADNAMYILFDHIYSKMTMKMKVDSTYHALRTIKVTKMTMTGSAPAVTVKVTYVNNGATEPSTSITAESSSTPIESTLMSSETELNTSLLDLTSFYCAEVLSSVTLTTTFDVYDKKGNKLRTGCETSNTITLKKLEAGKSYVIEATIKPTYLYQLGEEDLDKPTLVI